MPPLALIPIGLYAIVATVSADVAPDNAKNSSNEPEQNVTLTETTLPTKVIDGVQLARPNTSALATTSGLADPAVKAAIAKALRMQNEKNRQKLAQTAAPETFAQTSQENPGEYFSQTESDGDGGYSAPLGLKDESHNDWMK